MHSKYKVNSLHDTESINTGLVGLVGQSSVSSVDIVCQAPHVLHCLQYLAVVHWFTTGIFLATFDVMR